jgi:ribosomal protein S18 acetylase RimI-like enzyme
VTSLCLVTRYQEALLPLMKREAESRRAGMCSQAELGNKVERRPGERGFPMSAAPTSDPTVRFAAELAGIDWSRLKRTLSADRFDNGRTAEQLGRSFENSHSVCIAWSGGQIVGTARVLSDGVCNAYLVDVWTLSSVRRRGIAKEMIRQLTMRLAGQHIYLQADEHISEVYRRLGFREQPVGMSRIVGEWLAGTGD